MLFLTGQFEAGIEILYRSAKFASHSVHIAIAMHELGLLALSDNLSRPVCKFSNDFVADFGLKSNLFGSIRDFSVVSVRFRSETAETTQFLYDYQNVRGHLTGGGFRNSTELLILPEVG